MLALEQRSQAGVGLWLFGFHVFGACEALQASEPGRYGHDARWLAIDSGHVPIDVCRRSARDLVDGG
jgi:hypothetical protein